MAKRTEVLDGTVQTSQNYELVEQTYYDEQEEYDTHFMYSDSLEELEEGIKKAEKITTVAWFMTSIAVFRIFNDLLFTQSGLTKKEYEKQARQRLGLDRRRLSDAYQSGSFLTRYHGKLLEKGWTPEGQQRKLAYADRALRRHKNVDNVITHLVEDTKEQFEEYAKGPENATKAFDLNPRDDVEIGRNKITIQGIDAVTVSNDLPKDEKTMAWTHVKKLFQAIRDGYYPEILYCYDAGEGKRMQNALKKDRQSR